MNRLWRDLWLADSRPDQASQTSAGDEIAFLGLRVEALHRAGALRDVGIMMNAAPARGASAPPGLAVLRARHLIAVGKSDEGCRAQRGSSAGAAGRSSARVPRALRGMAALIAGYCAARRGDRAGAALSANLARDAGERAPLALAILEAMGRGEKPELSVPQRMDVLAFRFLRLVSSADPARVVPIATPALLAAIARDQTLQVTTRLLAGERAAQINALDARTLGAIYLAAAAAADAKTANAAKKGAQRRAAWFAKVTKDRDFVQRARAAYLLFDDARASGLAATVATLLQPYLDQMRDAASVDWFAEAAIEVALHAGDAQSARRWVAAAPPSLRHWRAVVEVAAVQGGPQARRRTQIARAPQEGRDNVRGIGRGDAGPGAAMPGLDEVERLARDGRIEAVTLHRLVTVLDALDVHTPIPLWEAASRTPQPTDGYLPPTGALARLSQGAKRADVGATALIALQALGKAGPRGANMLALGDVIKALRRVGLHDHARAIAVEALIAKWPRLPRR
ncbi:MAG: hypothetical protein AAFR04_07840 [Pseudomonadota bacterium]